MNASVSLNPYPAYNSFIPQVNPARTGNGSGDDVKYIVTTKILVLALSVLFAVVFFVVCLHIYAKWIWNTSPTRRGSPSFSSFWPRRRRNRSSSPTDDSSIVLDADAMANIHTITGLDKSAVEALPKFKYTTTDHLKSTDHLECAICLGKFEEDEMGRALPMCHHSFHLDCIDMWLYSHSTCPLCRAILEPIPSSPPTTSPSPSTSSSSSSTPPHSPSITPRQELHNITNLDELEESEHQEQEPANKRADSIPANILFWGNQASALSPVRIINNNSNSNSPRAATPSSQVVIDIVDSVDHVVESDHRRRDHHSSSPVASRSVQASLHRLLGRGRSGAMTSTTVDDGEEMMHVRPFRPSVSPSTTAAPSRVSLSVSSEP